MSKYTLGGDPPQSRAEKILMGQDAGPAQSRLEELLKNGAGGGVTPELPAVSAADNGKFLRVVNGAWAAEAVPSAESNSFGGGA